MKGIIKVANFKHFAFPYKLSSSAWSQSKDSSKPLKEPASAPSSAKMDGLVNVMWQANTRKGHAYFSFYSRAIEINNTLEQ